MHPHWSHHVLDRISKRLASESGFSLIELIVVVQILGILALIAVPALLSTAAQARVASTESNVNSAIPLAAMYFADAANNPTLFTFGGISAAKLRLQAHGVAANVKAGSKTVSTSHDAYCIQDTEDGGATYYHYDGGVGGAARVVAGACAPAYSVA